MKTKIQNLRITALPKRRGMAHSLHFALLGLSAAVPAFAQQAAPEATGTAEPTLPEVRVEARTEPETATGPVQGYVAKRSATATKTDTPLAEVPQSISVITRDQLTDRNATTLNEALQYSAGAATAVFGEDPRQDVIKVRGFDADIYLDGLSERSFYQGVRQDLYGIERVEVLRGPSSALYGAGGPGGILNMVSKRASLAPLREVFVGYGSYDTKEAGFDLGGAISDTLAWRLTGLGRDGETKLDHTENERLYIAPTLAWTPSADTRLDLMLRYQRDRDSFTYQWLPVEGTLYGNPNGRISESFFASEPSLDHADRDTWSVGYAFSHRLSDKTTFVQNVRYRDTQIDNAEVYGFGYLPGDLRMLNRFAWKLRIDEQALVIDNHIEHRIEGAGISHTLLAGVDVIDYENTRTDTDGLATPIDVFDPVYGGALLFGDPYSQHNTLTQTGVYLQDQIKYDQHWNLTLSGRYDWARTKTEPAWDDGTTQRDHRFTGRAGLTYVFDNGLAPYASYASGFKPVAGTDSSGNLLQPEYARQYEVGIKYLPSGRPVQLTAAVFDLTKTNVLTSDPTGMFQSQTGQVRSRGLELEGIAQLDRQWKILASYTYTDAEVTRDLSYQGKLPLTTPRNQASLWADYSFLAGVPGLSLAAGLRHVGAFYGDSDNQFETPSANYVDLALRYAAGPWKLSLNANNLTDKVVAICFTSYACNYSTGRTVTARLSYAF